MTGLVRSWSPDFLRCPWVVWTPWVIVCDCKPNVAEINVLWELFWSISPKSTRWNQSRNFRFAQVIENRNPGFWLVNRNRKFHSVGLREKESLQSKKKCFGVIFCSFPPLSHPNTLWCRGNQLTGSAELTRRHATPVAIFRAVLYFFSSLPFHINHIPHWFSLFSQKLCSLVE